MQAVSLIYKTTTQKTYEKIQISLSLFLYMRKSV
jgi:hypothetical protein